MADEPVVGVVPNFSEGRDAEVIDAIVSALRVPGARVVYAEADPDHHRLDTTVLGAPDAVVASAMAGAAVAVRRIDMFAPPRRPPADGRGRRDPVHAGTWRDDGRVRLARARDFGRALAETLDVPVYLYDRAALSPERASLAEVRRGEFEGLRDAVARGERLPDFGPHAIGRAGATAVGARKPLVAFNVYLDGTDEAAAKEIARGVRESSGGLPALRAIAFAVPERGGIVTVSMNLVDHEVTGLRDGVRRRGGARRRATTCGSWRARSWASCLRRRSRPATWSTFACAGSTRTGRSWSGCWPPRTRSET